MSPSAAESSPQINPLESLAEREQSRDINASDNNPLSSIEDKNEISEVWFAEVPEGSELSSEEGEVEETPFNDDTEASTRSPLRQRISEVAFNRLLNVEDAFKYFSEYDEHRKYESELCDNNGDAYTHWRKGLASYFQEKDDWDDIVSADVNALQFTYNSSSILHFLSPLSSNGVLFRLNSVGATDCSIKEALILRLVDLEVLHKDKVLLAIELIDLPGMQSLESTLCDAFDAFAACVGEKEGSFPYQATFPRVRHLIVNRSTIISVGPVLDRFEALVSLDLSRNKIAKFSKFLSLPHLLRLDVSYNRLESLDFTQNLKSLRFLDASYNHLRSLRKSIHVLLPLQNNLFSLDLIGNDVRGNLSYVDATLEILRSLQFLDGYDLHNLHYSRSHSLSCHTISSNMSDSLKSPSNRRPPVPKQERQETLKKSNTMINRLLRALRMFSRRPFVKQEESGSPIRIRNPLLSPDKIDPRSYIAKENSRWEGYAYSPRRARESFKKVAYQEFCARLLMKVVSMCNE